MKMKKFQIRVFEKELIIPFSLVDEEEWKKISFSKTELLKIETIGGFCSLENNIFIRKKLFDKLSKKDKEKIIIHETIHKLRNDRNVKSWKEIILIEKKIQNLLPIFNYDKIIKKVNEE